MSTENNPNASDASLRVKLLKEATIAATTTKIEQKSSFKDAINNDNNNNNLLDENDWKLERSDFAKNTCNPIRRLLEQLKLEPNPNKPMIALSIGDPTVLSDLEKPDIIKDIAVKYLNDKQVDGYTPSFGTEKSRAGVAKYYSRPPKVTYKPDDIFLTHGCSQSLDLSILVLANSGKNVLIPRPGFSIYKTLSNTFGIEERYYNLLPDKDWEIDLNHLTSQIDENTAAIIVNNPSNPCGSVFSMEHMLDIITIAKKYHLPIIADEVYGDMVFKDKEFYYFSELSDTVPILSSNAVSKRFIMPGWRFGWIAIHDPKNYCKDIRQGFMDLTTRILGPNSVVQAMTSELLEKTPQSYYDRTMEIVQINADLAFNKLSKYPGLMPKKPSGAMYMMVGIDLKCFPDIKDDGDFVQKLVQEQSVFCIPATVFCWPNYFRIVLTMKVDKIIEACDRIGDFIYKHHKPSPNAEK